MLPTCGEVLSLNFFNKWKIQLRTLSTWQNCCIIRLPRVCSLALPVHWHVTCSKDFDLAIINSYGNSASLAGEHSPSSFTIDRCTIMMVDDSNDLKRVRYIAAGKGHHACELRTSWSRLFLQTTLIASLSQNIWHWLAKRIVVHCVVWLLYSV